jgi:retron-type reverse transcriptase
MFHLLVFAGVRPSGAGNHKVKHKTRKIRNCRASGLVQVCIQEGRHWVVDVDLEQFFDRVNHDVLMGKLAKRIADRRLLGLVRRFLEAGILANGIAMERHEGTPQGGPLSPLLANVLLDEVDKELEKRGHSFVRYADDCNVYLRSKRAGERVMQAPRCLFADLRLRVANCVLGECLETQPHPPRPPARPVVWEGRSGESRCPLSRSSR